MLLLLRTKNFFLILKYGKLYFLTEAQNDTIELKILRYQP